MTHELCKRLMSAGLETSTGARPGIKTSRSLVWHWIANDGGAALTVEWFASRPSRKIGLAWPRMSEPGLRRREVDVEQNCSRSSPS